MDLPQETSVTLFNGRHFNCEIIVLCVRWYVSYKLSYRDLVAIMAERNIDVTHTTITTLGAAVCAGVCEAVAAPCSTGGHLVARR